VKKCVATVIYRNNMVYNLTVNCRGESIPLVRYDLNGVTPYKYESFQRMYHAILNTLANNNFYVEKFHDFGKTLYNIQFINLDNPVEIERFYR